MVGNFQISRAPLLGGESEFFANYLRVNQSEHAKGTFHLCGITV